MLSQEGELEKKKKTNLFAILTLAAIPAFLHAQITSYSDTVGYQTISVPVGLSTAAFPLLNADIVKTSASSLTGNALSLSGETNVGSKLSSGEPYYIEVYSGALKGDRFDVNTAATITAANGTVVLDSASANNTFSFGSIAAQLDGANVALRKHITIEQIQSMASASLVGSNSASSADQIQLYDGASSAYASYFLRGDGITWRKVGTTTTANKTPVPPGTGVFIAKKTGTVNLVSTGSVRNNDFSLPYQTGLQLLAPGFPIDISASSLGATASNGWTGSNSSSSADQIQVYNSGASAYDAYFLRGDGTSWRKVGTTTTVTGTLATSAQAFFVSRKAQDNNNYLVNPVAP